MLGIIAAVDSAVTAFCDMIRGPFLDTVLPIITRLGDKGVLWIAIGLILLCIRKYRRQGIFLLLCLLLTAALGELILKPLVGRARPFIANPELVLLIPAPESFSFPSGHTASSFTAAFAIAFMWKKWAAPALTMAGLIAFSRLYLNVHYTSDVLGGLLLGTAVACFLWFCFGKKWVYEGRSNPLPAGKPGGGIDSAPGEGEVPPDPGDTSSKEEKQDG